MGIEMSAAFTQPYRLFSLLLFCIAATVTAPSVICQGAGGAPPAKLTIPDGTVLHLVLMDDLQGKNLKAGDQVHFRVREDLLIEHQVLVHTGSIAIGHITLVNKNGFVGKSGKINIHIDFVNAVNSTQIRLRGDPGIPGGNQRAVTAAATAYYGPAALFIRGWDAKIPVGTMLNAFVDGDQTVSLAPLPPPSEAPSQQPVSVPPPSPAAEPSQPPIPVPPPPRPEPFN
jgi:hypothetical protein